MLMPTGPPATKLTALADGKACFHTKLFLSFEELAA
jgi:hypothetical protein